ncbi:galactosyltransferase-domain-containing protein [Zychaea mexicana]|uniref:galactosyltransferase-domain-containing protein n=1 Tax=Zychaea mexicana TaxID=64656 RepID=UPI0022FF2E8A|nr:galactosyltransferase-domain-containing protein [Zychaea mexicana]KAI9498277.1 galactosyltransferase-domain-containing protein [Zychaea mexicana]
MKNNALPSFRQRGLSLSSLNVPRRYHLPIILLRTLCFIPSVLGTLYNTQQAWGVPIRDSGGAITLKSTESDYWVASIWCVLAGYWSWILTTSMMRRWLYHYEISNAIVRLLTLTFVNWSISAFVCSKIESDRPIRIWMTICLILLISNVLKLCFGTSPKYHQKTEDVLQSPVRINLKSTAVKVLVLPLTVVTFLTTFVALQQLDGLQYTTSQLMMHQPFGLNHNDLSIATTTTAAISSSTMLILIISSWSPEAFERRQMLRKTDLKLAMDSNNNNNNVAYRFVIGQPPSARSQMLMGPRIENESETYRDMLLVPASDLHTDKSRKVFEAFRWSLKFKYDYLVKSDDDVFVRWDTVKNELRALGRQSAYWKGLVYRNMAPDALGVDKTINADYPLPILPSYTSGTMYILSQDVVNLIVGIDSPQRFVSAEERNLGIWLFGYNINPIHDYRVQDGSACEQNQIAKRFKNKKLGEMQTMYDNIINGREQCTSLDTSTCGLCYPCRDKKDDWRASSLSCDQFKGVTDRHSSPYLKVSGPDVKDTLAPSVVGENDDWIIDGLLSQRTSKFSETDDWHLLYWVCWTSDPSTFTDRHWRALELVWVHEPRAVIFMISNTLPKDFFQDYTHHGYEIHVVHFNKENLLNWHWYFGPGTLDWLRDWDKWENGKFFYWHLTDYIRCLLLYNYGGTYMDMDALWIRVPPDHNLEFIGSDYSSLISDREWTLDDEGLYLPQGLMRFKRGWALFREMCESAFSSYSYDPECFNCHGPKAITSYVREHRAALELAGFTILPREVLYPASYLEIHRYLLANPLAEQELKTKIVVNSWNIHLFGKMTNHLPIEKGSLVDLVLRRFDLDIPHRDTATNNAVISSTGAWTVPMRLVGPRNYIYRYMSPFTHIPQESTDSRRRALQQPAAGRFQGLDRIYVRGGPSVIDKVQVTLEVAFGKLKIGVPASPDFIKDTIELKDASQKDINVILNSLVYSPSPLLAANGGRDRMSVLVEYSDGERDEVLVDVIVVESEEDGEI